MALIAGNRSNHQSSLNNGTLQLEDGAPKDREETLIYRLIIKWTECLITGRSEILPKSRPVDTFY
jgi:hypothetical protein